MTDGTKHNHHTVPKFYLRGFSKKEKHEKVNVVNLLKGTHTEQRIETASVIPDYYSIRTEEFGHPDVKEDDFENWLSEEFERPTGRVLKKINGGAWPLDREDRATLAKFIALQYMRGNAHRALMDDIGTFVAYGELAANGRENLRAGLRKHFNKDYTEESLDKIWSEIVEGTFRIEHHQHTYLVTIMEDLPKMIPFFLGRQWFLVKFSHKKLITSDNPVVIVPDSEGKLGLGVAPEILFPLSRTAAIVMAEFGSSNSTYAENYDTISPANAITHKQFIDNIVNNDPEYLYCHPDDKDTLPQPLPKPRQPRNFKDEAKQFIELGEAIRNNNKPIDEDSPN